MMSAETLLSKRNCGIGPDGQFVIASYLFQRDLFSGVRAREWSQSAISTLLELARLPTDRIHGLLVACHHSLDKGEIEEGRQYLDRAFEVVETSRLSVTYAAHIVWVEKAFFAAYYDHDVKLARKMLAEADLNYECLRYGKLIAKAAIEVEALRMPEAQATLLEVEDELNHTRRRTGCNVERGTEIIADLRSKLKL